MQTVTLLFGAALLSTAAAAVNGRCSGTATGSYLSNGICIDTGTCNSYSRGSYITGGCPNDPNNIKCCYIQGCTDSTSYCGWTSNGCSGPFQPGFCPGPSNYECCNY
ncbi:hypothetical protein F5Y19DRAFT_458434 [Xylariaceae sp. FL1651]|nr:hypothetical protein F5Y19DRAFT_458434 [Xylariaceae sp. FL1651]